VLLVGFLARGYLGVLLILSGAFDVEDKGLTNETRYRMFPCVLGLLLDLRLDPRSP
jgi:hypothetical protein